MCAAWPEFCKKKLIDLIGNEFNTPHHNVYLDAPEAKDMFLEMQKEIGYFPATPSPARIKIKYFTRIKSFIWSILKKFELFRKIRELIKSKDENVDPSSLYISATKIQIDMDYYNAKSLSEVVPHIEELNREHKGNVFGNLLESIKFGIIKNIFIKN